MNLKDRIIELAPHYAVMLVLIFVTLTVLRGLFGEQSFWIELLILLAVVFAYPPVVRRLGYAPSSWQREADTE